MKVMIWAIILVPISLLLGCCIGSALCIYRFCKSDNNNINGVNHNHYFNNGNNYAKQQDEGTYALL